MMKNECRAVTDGIDAHDAAGRHFQLFFAVADEDNGLAEGNAVALHAYCAARERSNRRKRISLALGERVRADANEKNSDYQEKRVDVSGHHNSPQVI
jgi:hypothetical protein